MIEIIGIRFRGQGKTYYFSPNGAKTEAGDYCVVETARGTECGEVTIANKMVADALVVQPLKPIIRLATSDDMRKLADNARREKDAWNICQKKIEEHKLDMKLVEIEYAFDDSKILFYFTSDGRVDFRELVKDLAGIFRTRIELRQIGVRDEAKTLGGLGICGRPFCCSDFLPDFQPVSIKMAKEQGLSLNPTKISGTCGRLMCCLKYEQEAYEDLIKTTPRLGSSVKTPEGVGTVIDVHLVKGECKVRFDDRVEAAVQTFTRDEMTVLRSGKEPRDQSDGSQQSRQQGNPAQKENDSKRENERQPRRDKNQQGQRREGENRSRRPENQQRKPQGSAPKQENTDKSGK